MEDSHKKTEESLNKNIELLKEELKEDLSLIHICVCSVVIKFKYVYHYLDDIVIYSESMDQHLAHLR